MITGYTTDKALNDPMDELKNGLEMLKEKSSEGALAYAIQAQLVVINSIYSANLMLSSVDLLLQSLKLAIDHSVDNYEKDTIRIKAATMINSMVFFAEAKIYYEENKWRDEGIELLKQGCELLVDSVNAIAGMYKEETPELNISVQELLIFFTEKQGFIKRFVERMFLKKQKYREFYEMKKEFMKFVYLLVKKLDIYSDMFGESILLAELIEKYISDLVEMYCDDKPYLQYVSRPEYGNIRLALAFVFSLVTVNGILKTGLSFGNIVLCLVAVLIGLPVYVDLFICIPNRFLAELAYKKQLALYEKKKYKIHMQYKQLADYFRGTSVYIECYNL